MNDGCKRNVLVYKYVGVYGGAQRAGAAIGWFLRSHSKSGMEYEEEVREKLKSKEDKKGKGG